MNHGSLEEMQERLTAATMVLGEAGEITFRSMFGGVGVYHNGRIFSTLSDVGLALKFGPTTVAELLKVPEAKLLRYDPSAPESKSYVVVPLTIQFELDEFSHWVRKSLDFVATLPAPKPKKSK